jgi:hypothetical protein
MAPQVLSILLLPPITVGLEPAEGERVGGAIREWLTRLRPDQVRIGPAVDECDDGCASELADRFDVQEVVVVNVARMAETTVVQMSVYDRTRGEFVRRAQETGEGEDPTEAATAVVVRLYPPDLRPRHEEPATPAPAPARRSEPTPWYGRWWVVSGAGAVLAGAVVTVVLLANDGGGDGSNPPPGSEGLRVPPSP